MTQASRHRRAVDRIEALHEPVWIYGDPNGVASFREEDVQGQVPDFSCWLGCAECGRIEEAVSPLGPHAEYPCPTIRALNAGW